MLLKFNRCFATPGMYHPPRKIDAVKLEAPQKVDCKMQKPHIQAQDLKTKKSSKKANVYFWYDR